MSKLYLGCQRNNIEQKESAQTQKNLSHSEIIEKKDGKLSEKKGGRFRQYRTHRFDINYTQEQREMIEQLESIGYMSGVNKAGSLSGVIKYDKNKAQDGLNFYTSGHGSVVLLMDMEGIILHEWKIDFREIWPNYPIPLDNENSQFIRRAHLFENGDLLCIYDGLGLVKIDKKSHLIWDIPNRAHHDLE